MFAWGVKVWLAGATGCSLSGAAERAEILTGVCLLWLSAVETPS